MATEGNHGPMPTMGWPLRAEVPASFSAVSIWQFSRLKIPRAAGVSFSLIPVKFLHFYYFRIIFLLVITTLGACGSVASIVLTALESDLLNYLRHPGSAHPCANKSTTNRLTEKQC